MVSSSTSTEGRSRSRGKWSLPNVPHKGWVCIDVEDLESPSKICEMCETQEIRYVHHMKHPDHDLVLGVGCVCAEYMEEDSVSPQQRELRLRNLANRRRNWLTRKWQISERGNQYLNTDGFNITVFRVTQTSWGGRIEDVATGRVRHSKERYATEEEVKLAAFNAMILLKEKRGWGH